MKRNQRDPIPPWHLTCAYYSYTFPLDNTNSSDTLRQRAPRALRLLTAPQQKQVLTEEHNKKAEFPTSS